jgi:MFS family permease
MAEERSAKYGWWVTTISALTCFGIYASVTAYSVAVPKIATALHVSKSDASLGVSVFLVGLALALIVGGMIIDRIGIKNTVLLGMLLLIVPQFVIPSTLEVQPENGH